MKHNNRALYLLLLLTFYIPNPAIGQQSNRDSTEAVQANWLAALNNSKSLSSFYSDNSGILLNDELFIGVDEINKQLQAFIKITGHFKNYNLLEVHQLRDHQMFVLGEYKTISGEIYSAITAWTYRDKWTKALEVIYSNNDYTDNGIDSVNQARAQWEKHSNEHRPDLIVEKIFSENGKYFNRGKLYNGREIAGAYSYMNSESYTIKLEALKVLQVNCDIIYDIGTFKVGGKGLYTLIWKKVLGEWKLLLDFNF